MFFHKGFIFCQWHRELMCVSMSVAACASGSLLDTSMGVVLFPRLSLFWADLVGKDNICVIENFRELKNSKTLLYVNDG